jgi:hypothetical protein
MSNPDASEAARTAARARWTPSPVVARSVQVIVSRPGELTDSQWAAIEASRAAAITEEVPDGV